MWAEYQREKYGILYNYCLKVAYTSREVAEIRSTQQTYSWDIN